MYAPPGAMPGYGAPPPGVGGYPQGGPPPPGGFAPPPAGYSGQPVYVPAMQMPARTWAGGLCDCFCACARRAFRVRAVQWAALFNRPTDGERLACFHARAANCSVCCMTCWCPCVVWGCEPHRP